MAAQQKTATSIGDTTSKKQKRNLKKTTNLNKDAEEERVHPAGNKHKTAKLTEPLPGPSVKRPNVNRPSENWERDAPYERKTPKEKEAKNRVIDKTSERATAGDNASSGGRKLSARREHADGDVLRNDISASGPPVSKLQTNGAVGGGGDELSKAKKRRLRKRKLLMSSANCGAVPCNDHQKTANALSEFVPPMTVGCDNNVGGKQQKSNFSNESKVVKPVENKKFTTENSCSGSNSIGNNSRKHKEKIGKNKTGPPVPPPNINNSFNNSNILSAKMNSSTLQDVSSSSTVTGTVPKVVSPHVPSRSGKDKDDVFYFGEESSREDADAADKAPTHLFKDLLLNLMHTMKINDDMSDFPFYSGAADHEREGTAVAKGSGLGSELDKLGIFGDSLAKLESVEKLFCGPTFSQISEIMNDEIDLDCSEYSGEDLCIGNRNYDDPHASNDVLQVSEKGSRDKIPKEKTSVEGNEGETTATEDQRRIASGFAMKDSAGGGAQNAPPASKTREEVIAEREAKKAAKAAAKAAKSKPSAVNIANAGETKSNTTSVNLSNNNINDDKQKVKNSLNVDSEGVQQVTESLERAHLTDGKIIGDNKIRSESRALDVNSKTSKDVTNPAPSSGSGRRVCDVVDGCAVDKRSLFRLQETPLLKQKDPPVAKDVACPLKKEEEEEAAAASGKSKAELRAERRAKQEAQRAAKAAAKDKVTQNAEVKEVLVEIGTKTEVEKKDAKIISSSDNQYKAKLFSHLYFEKEQIHEDYGTLHPSILQLGVQYGNRIVCGSNARCLALLHALKKMIRDYSTPLKQEFSRGLEGMLAKSMSYLNHHRPASVSMVNAIRHIKRHLTQIPNTITDSDAKQKLYEIIETYVREQIDVAGEAISNTVQKKITNGDVILIYGCSSLIHRILVESHKSGTKFSVIVVDGGPWFEGKEMLRRLVRDGLTCSYVLISAASFVMREVNKVLLGAHALLANGYVMSRAGTSQVALLAHSCNVAVLVCCETHKFSERVQTDAFVHNELGDPDEMLSNKTGRISQWRSYNYLTPLSLAFDVTPPDLVTAVVTEVGILPCTSVPVILRIKPSETIV